MALQFTVKERVRATPERVFAALTDLEGAKAWMPGFVGIHKLTPGAFAAGTRWRETRKMYGREATEEFEVTACEPTERIELYVDGKKGSSRRGEFRFRYELTPAEKGTVVTLHGEVSGLGKVMEFFGRLFIGSFKRAISRDLEAMRVYLESR